MLIQVYRRNNIPIKNAFLRIEFANGPPMETTTDQFGNAEFGFPRIDDKAYLIVTAPRYQRIKFELTRSQLTKGVSLKLYPVNEWYYVQRGFEAPLNALVDLPIAGRYVAALQILAKPAAFIAIVPFWKRMAANMLFGVAAIIFFLWALGKWRNEPLRLGARTYALTINKPNEIGPGLIEMAGSILIQKDGSLYIKPGTQLKFYPGEGITVHGELRAEGNVNDRNKRIKFSPLNATDRWGNIVAMEGARIILKGCDILSGGGISVQVSADPNVGIILLSNQAPESLRGGGLFVYKADICELQECEFRECEAALGGAVYFRQTSATITSTLFIENKASAEGRRLKGGGGAVCMWHATPVFRNCKFIKNSTRNKYGCGGAVYAAKQSVPIFSGCIFRENTALAQGGAIYANNTHLDIKPTLTQPFQICGNKKQKCVFDGNKAGDNREGGAVAILGKVWVHVTDAQFHSNSAKTGGALFFQLKAVENTSDPWAIRVLSNEFKNNVSTGSLSGTDLVLEARKLSEAEISNNKFIETEQKGASKIRLSLEERLDQAQLLSLTSSNFGIGIEDIDAGYRRLVEIKYFKQPSLFMCQASALFMTLLYADPVKAKDLSIESIFDELSKHPDGAESHSARCYWLNQYLPRNHHNQEDPWKLRYIENIHVVLEEIVHSIRNGDPVVFSTNFTHSGHVILIVGYDIFIDKTRPGPIIAHDPEGWFNLDCTPPRWKEGRSGEWVSYSIDSLVTTIEYRLRSPEKGTASGLEYRRKSLTGESSWLNVMPKMARNIISKNRLCQTKPSIVKRDWEYIVRKSHCIECIER